MALIGKENEPRMKITENDLPQTFTVKLLGRKDALGLWGIKNTRQPVDNLIAKAKAQNLSLPIVRLHITKEGVQICELGQKQYKQVQIKEPENNNQNSSLIVKPSCPKKAPRTIFTSLKHSVFAFKTKKNTNNNQIVASINRPEPKHLKCERKRLETDFALIEKLKKEARESFGRTFVGIDTISYGVQDLVFTRVFCMIVVTDCPDQNPFDCYAFVCEDRQVARAITYSLAAAFQIYSRSIKAHRPIVHMAKETDRLAKILSIDLRTPEQKKEDQCRLLDSEA